MPEHHVRLDVGYRLVLQPSGRELSLAPKERALYQFFLLHPDGIVFSHLPDRTEELVALYLRFYTGSSDDRESPRAVAERVIRKLVFDTDGDRSQTVSKVNRKVRTALEGLVEQPLAFCIQGPNGGIKRVAAASWAVHIKTNE
jgi:hypothetical protein